MGVRWLWPGEVGTYVPETETILVPDMEVSERPSLSARLLRVPIFRARRGLGHGDTFDEFHNDEPAYSLYREADR